MATIKEIKEQYIGKPYDTDRYSVITKVVSAKMYGGEAVCILLSGSYSKWGGGYWVEAVIDRATGENLIPQRNRPADTIDDAIDVALEMYYEEKRSPRC